MNTVPNFIVPSSTRSWDANPSKPKLTELPELSTSTVISKEEAKDHIIGQLATIDCGGSFAFEIKHMHEARDTSLGVNTTGQDLSMAKKDAIKFFESLPSIKESTIKKEKVGSLIKTLCSLFTLIEILSVFIVFFATISFTIKNIPIEWINILLDVATSLIFISLLIKGAISSQFSLETLKKYYLIIISFAILQLLLLIYLVLKNDLLETFKLALNLYSSNNTGNDIIKSIMCISSLYLMMSSLYKTIAASICGILCIVYERRIRDDEGGELNHLNQKDSRIVL